MAPPQMMAVYHECRNEWGGMNQEMTRLCFFNTTRFWGGGEKWHFETADYLSSCGHHVLFIAHPRGELLRRLADRPIKVAPIAVSNLSFLNPIKSKKLINLFRSEKIQTVIFNGSSDVKLGAPAARIAGVQAVVYRRGLAVPVNNSLLNRFLYGRLITHFLTNSEATAQQLFQHIAVPRSSLKIRTIYNGIDFSSFRTPCSEAPQCAPDRKLVIGMAGRLEEQKGHKYMLAAACRLKEQHLDFNLLIAGEGSQRHRLRNQIQALGLTDVVHLLGFVSHIQSLMRRIDIFVFPSLWEGFGYAAVEAMAAGRPVIAFDVSSNREVVEHGVTGFLVPALNIDAFAERIMQLARDRELRAWMGVKGQARVCDMFDQAAQLKKVEAFLCEEVLGR